MYITHIAIYVKDIEKVKDFYIKYFNAKANEKYINEKKGFESYFLSFEEGATLEIMCKQGVHNNYTNTENLSLTHIAFSVGNDKAVDELSQRLLDDGFTKLDGPRHTGDGYYEALFFDPENNRIEITS